MISNTNILSNLYEVLIEANMSNHDNTELIGENDQDINNAIFFIRRLNIKAKADLNKKRHSKAKELMEEFLSRVGNNIDTILSKLSENKENEPIVAFWRNYKNMSDYDKSSMLLDQKMLDFISKAKDIQNDGESKG